MKVIGVFGQLASGKDTVADYLAKELYKLSGIAWARTAFADAVKKVYEDTFGVSRNFVETYKRNPEPPSGMLMNVRKSLQFIGDGFRQIKESIWIDIALRDNICKVISDGRYLNEARAIRDKGGINILLWRPSFENNDPNPSESQIKPVVDWCVEHFCQKSTCIDLKDTPEDISLFDVFICNKGTVQDLYEIVDDLLIPYISHKGELN